MTNPLLAFLRGIRRVWADHGRRRAQHHGRVPEVIVHDPGATRAQNLDDPFLDKKAQERAATLIARAAQSSETQREPRTPVKKPSKDR